MFWTKWFRTAQKVLLTTNIILYFIVMCVLASVFTEDGIGFMIGLGIFILMTIISITFYSFFMMISDMSVNLYSLTKKQGDPDYISVEEDESENDKLLSDNMKKNIVTNFDFDTNDIWYCICGQPNREGNECCISCGRKNRRQ